MLDSLKKNVYDLMLYHIIFCPSFRDITCITEPSPMTFDTTVTLQCSCGFRARYYEDEVNRRYGINNFHFSEEETFDRELFDIIRSGYANNKNQHFVKLVYDYYKKNQDELKDGKTNDEMKIFTHIEKEDELKRRIKFVSKKMGHAILSMEI